MSAEHLRDDYVSMEQFIADTKAFLDHMRETCVNDRQTLKLENRRLRDAIRAHRDRKRSLAMTWNEADQRLWKALHNDA